MHILFSDAHNARNFSSYFFRARHFNLIVRSLDSSRRELLDPHIASRASSNNTSFAQSRVVCHAEDGAKGRDRRRGIEECRIPRRRDPGARERGKRSEARDRHGTGNWFRLWNSSSGKYFVRLLSAVIFLAPCSRAFHFPRSLYIGGRRNLSRMVRKVYNEGITRARTLYLIYSLCPSIRRSTGSYIPKYLRLYSEGIVPVDSPSPRPIRAQCRRKGTRLYEVLNHQRIERADAVIKI